MPTLTTTEGDKRLLFWQERPMAKDSSGNGANWYQGTISNPAGGGSNVESRFFFEGTVSATDMSRATDAREAGRIGIFGTSNSYGGSYGRVTNEALGRDLNPLGRGNGQALVAGMLNVGKIAPVLPKSVMAGGRQGNSVNNPCGGSGGCGASAATVRNDLPNPIELLPSPPHMGRWAGQGEPPWGWIQLNCDTCCAKEWEHRKPGMFGWEFPNLDQSHCFTGAVIAMCMNCCCDFPPGDIGVPTWPTGPGVVPHPGDGGGASGNGGSGTTPPPGGGGGNAPGGGGGSKFMDWWRDTCGDETDPCVQHCCKTMIIAAPLMELSTHLAEDIILCWTKCWQDCTEDTDDPWTVKQFKDCLGEGYDLVATTSQTWTKQ